MAVPFLSITTTGTLRNNYSGWVGHHFRPSGRFLVSSIGRYVASGNSQSHDVMLRYGSSCLFSGTINTSGESTGTYVYLATPTILLASGQNYNLQTFEHNGGDYWFDSNLIVSGVSGAILGHANGDSYYSSPNNSYVPTNFLFDLVAEPADLNSDASLIPLGTTSSLSLDTGFDYSNPTADLLGAAIPADPTLDYSDPKTYKEPIYFSLINGGIFDLSGILTDSNSGHYINFSGARLWPLFQLKGLSVAGQMFVVGGKNEIEGSPGAPCLVMHNQGVFQFRLSVASGSHNISVNVKQAANISPRPSLVIRKNPDIGLVSDVTSGAMSSTDWTTIGPVVFETTVDGAVWVELRNNAATQYNITPCFWDHVTVS